ncbi:hypothetical protein SCP_0800820 [Sparassis crispa]|uniref:Myosin motor domain-containing protein n=1 Tax=Sparassis crispa TaxID=139825 RepID=A0A401GTL2_9APHY|nr:hypothetical protein SCP_0800820 [Sparassis crispa]GBE85565.1 hypothetical protein SCP_0800820 [Sparassis crispa]
MTSRPNFLDQFCVNYANERLQNFKQKKLFERHVSEYTTEGISCFVPQVPYFDNSECLRLLQHKPGGLIHIMDDQARRQPRKTDHTVAESFAKRGPVTYSSHEFLDRDLDALDPDFVSLLRGASASTTDTPSADGSGSINPFVRGLYSAKAIATQAHPRNEDTIVAAQQPVKPMRAPSMRRKNTIKRMPTLKECDLDEKEREDEEPLGTMGSGGAPCVAGEFRTALDTLFETLEETQSWYVFCINPNDSQLPNQLEGQSVKGQVRSLGLAEIAWRSVNVFEVTMLPDEFVRRYKAQISSLCVVEGDPREMVEQARTVLGLQVIDIVLGLHKVFLSQIAFHSPEDDPRSRDIEELKRNRLRDTEAEAGLNPRRFGDPYAPYATPGADTSSYEEGGYNNPFSQSSQVLPLVVNTSPFQRADMYNEYDERKSLRSDDYDGRSAFTSQRDNDSTSNFGTGAQNDIFQNASTLGPGSGSGAVTSTPAAAPTSMPAASLTFTPVAAPPTSDMPAPSPSPSSSPAPPLINSPDSLPSVALSSSLIARMVDTT